MVHIHKQVLFRESPLTENVNTPFGVGIQPRQVPDRSDEKGGGEEKGEKGVGHVEILLGMSVMKLKLLNTSLWDFFTRARYSHLIKAVYPACWKWWSFVKISLIVLSSIICMLAQSVNPHSLSR